MPRKRRAPDEAGAGDWRQPLYFLHGEVFTEDDDETTTWKGTWVASESGLPALQEFEESEESFVLSSGDFLGTGVPLEIRCPIGRSGTFSGSYTMGDGRSFGDHNHRLVVLDHDGERCSLVAERGESTIGGEYISIGRLVFAKRGDKGPTTLTLARRYLTADNPRVNQTPWQFVTEIANQVNKGAACREKDDFAAQMLAPWKLLE